MPQLPPDEYAEISRMIDELQPEIGNFYAAANNFVRDQVERKKEYGERMFMSPKQVKWIKDLHAEYVGNTDTSTPQGVDEQMSRRGDMDDDIPF